MTRRQNKTLAVAAYRAHDARERADTRSGARIVFLSQQEGLGRRIATGAATSRAIARVVVTHGYVPRWVDLDRHTRIDVEALEEYSGEHASPARDSDLSLWRHYPSGDDRRDAYEARGFSVRFTPARLP